MKFPPLNTLRAFEATGRLASLTRASAELNITHAAVSQQIKQLETWFGCRLFERNGRGVSLNSTGREFYEATSTALKLISTSGERIRNVRDATKFTVGCIPSVATRWLIPDLQVFLSAHPHVDIRVQYAHGFQKFDAGQHDALVTLSDPKDSRFDTVQLFSRVNRPVASALYLEKHPELLRPDGLGRADLLHDETRQSWSEWFASAGMEHVAISRGPVYQDFNLLAGSIFAGHGIGLCPVEIFRREITRGDLVVLSDFGIMQDQWYYLVTPVEAPRQVHNFVDWFTALCSDG